ncbi:DUF3077 domain-containing protein [Bordetella sp. FB-8]|uniref:DUF3077 domain-containing protein n=1 Tax=Bordetella sp. FB-8 TaxID=1159870 RepID=UPI0003642C2F|nr:DUF3077 domain-containing protein [Bordetella sp. FB-8]
MANHHSRTSAQSFFPLGSKGDHLFSVRAGASVEDVLNQVHCILLSALEVALETARAADTSKAWATVYLLEMAQAEPPRVLRRL